MGVRYYFRYADDIAIFGADKTYLHNLFGKIKEYFRINLKLEIKGNYQIFPLDIRGLDMLGYRYFRKYTLMRKRIKRNFARAVAKGKSPATIASYKGWAKHCNSRHLIKTLLQNEKI